MRFYLYWMANNDLDLMLFNIVQFDCVHINYTEGRSSEEIGCFWIKYIELALHVNEQSNQNIEPDWYKSVISQTCFSMQTSSFMLNFSCTTDTV